MKNKNKCVNISLKGLVMLIAHSNIATIDPVKRTELCVAMYDQYDYFKSIYGDNIALGEDDIKEIFNKV